MPLEKFPFHAARFACGASARAMRTRACKLSTYLMPSSSSCSPSLFTWLNVETDDAIGGRCTCGGEWVAAVRQYDPTRANHL
eukprot:6010215-Pleurochrysis_carterae.AAC.4